MQRSDDPAPFQQAGFGPDDFDPAVVYRWLGTPFAMVDVPTSRARYASRLSESSHHPGAATAPRPVCVTVHHEVDDGSWLVASTRLLSDGEDRTVRTHLWHAVRDYQLDAIGRSGIRLWESEPPPADVQDRLRFDPRTWPGGVGTRTVLLDGEWQSWDSVDDNHVVTAQPLSACGARLDGPTVVVVVGPTAAMDGLAVVVRR